MKEIRVGLLGFGGIAASHKIAYDALHRAGVGIRLVAICDKKGPITGGKVTTNLGAVDIGSLDGINLYTSFLEMVKCEKLDAVDICLPTFLHREYAVLALSMGLHVLTEKPMALTSSDCALMLDAARQSGKQLMVGQCLRFDGCYRYLRSLIENGRYGKLRRISLSRLSALPSWGAGDVYKCIEKTGGCRLDLHIHDIDMLRFLLGDPSAVSAVSTLLPTGEEYISTRLFYDGIFAEAEASFDEAATTPFYMGYRARFDEATVILNMDTVTVYPERGEPFVAEVNGTDRIEAEIKYFAEFIRNGVNKENSPSDSAASIRLTELIKESARLDGEKIET